MRTRMLVVSPEGPASTHFGRMLLHESLFQAKVSHLCVCAYMMCVYMNIHTYLCLYVLILISEIYYDIFI